MSQTTDAAASATPEPTPKVMRRARRPSTAPAASPPYTPFQASFLPAPNKRGLVLCSTPAPRRPRPPAKHAVQATLPAARSAAWCLRGCGYGHADAFTVSQKPYKASQASCASADSPV
jgi:hypothetical protein